VGLHGDLAVPKTESATRVFIKPKSLCPYAFHRKYGRL
jgi:hypothetical protein